MNKVPTLFFLSLLFFFTTLLVSCSEKDSEVQEGNGITEQNWSENETFFISAGQTLSFTFTAQSNWTVQNRATVFLSLDNNAGNSGKSTLKVTANKSSQEEGIITIKVNGYTSVSSFKIKLKSESGTNDNEINYIVDDYLKAKYLWNEEYQTLTPDLTLPYDDFLENTLMSMRTNTLDKKKHYYNGQMYYTLYSNIQKLENNVQPSRSAKEPKEKEYKYGFMNFTRVRYNDQNHVAFVTQGVYPDSPAAKAGIKRGTEITHINNQPLTESNWAQNYIALMSPTSATTLNVKDYNGVSYKISPDAIYQNPIIHSQVTTIGAHKIGYLVYSAFEAGYDEELFNEFKNFKNQHITDLILDFRYNGGGHVISANLIASCIAGASCMGKTFASYRYNNNRMKALNNKQPIEQFAYTKYNNLNNISLSDGGLGLPKVYFLVTDQTASASELVINSLKGIGVGATLIGSTTNGKNVGMEGVVITTSTAKYRFFPITFQAYNALGFGDYENGFAPDYQLDENDPKGSGYFDSYHDYGSNNEPLYAKAIELITGTKTVKSNTRSVTRSMGKAINDIPETKRIGMIK